MWKGVCLKLEGQPKRQHYCFSVTLLDDTFWNFSWLTPFMRNWSISDCKKKQNIKRENLIIEVKLDKINIINEKRNVWKNNRKKVVRSSLYWVAKSTNK